MTNPVTISPERPKPAKPKMQRRKLRMLRTNRAQRLSQLFFAGFILVGSVRHAVSDESAGLASVDALCPFGAAETLWTWMSTGKYIPKTHPSNLVLGLAVVIGTLLAGNAFCGWICPFGAFQDALAWVRRKLRLPEVKIGRRLDKVLRYGRFVSLGVIIYATVSTVKLWFAEYDPYRTLFGLHWLFEFDWASMQVALAILAFITVASLLVERFWCKYLCPLGGVLTVLQHFSFLRIRRTPIDACASCRVCDPVCPMNIDVSTAKTTVSADCIGCLKCVSACPRKDILEVRLAPRWLDPIRKQKTV